MMVKIRSLGASIAPIVQHTRAVAVDASTFTAQVAGSSLEVRSTGGRQTCTTITRPVTGTRDLYLKFSGGNGYLLDINWWRFSEGSSS